MAAFDEKDYTRSFDWSIWKRLTPFVRPFRRDFVGMLVFNGLCALVDVAIPLFQRYAIRNFIQADSLRGIVPFSLVYLLVILLQALSVVAFARNSMTIEMNMGRDMRRSLFHHLQTLSFSFYNVTPVGYLLTRVMSDTNRIASMIAWNMTDILWALFYVLGTFAAMLALNWRLALVVIVIVPVMAVLTGYFQNRILRWNRKVRKLNSRITGSFNEGITGAKTTKTLGTEEQTVAAFRDLTRQMHDAGIGAARLNAIYIPLVPPTYEFDISLIEKGFAEGAKALILCNPSNPCGKVFRRDELEAIAKLAIQYDAFVVTDEVYEHIIYAPAEHICMASLPGMFEHTITCNSLSKTYSITGWRLGYLIGPAEVIEGARKVHDFLTVGAAAPLQEAAVAGLEMPASYYEKLQALYTEKRDHFLAGLDRVGLKHNVPQGTYFVMIDISDFLALSQFKGWTDLQFCEWMIREVGVAAVPGSSFFREPVNHLIRMHFARGTDVLDEAVRRLEKLQALLK